ncbi:zinc finger SWIM-type protein [Fadolivirus algeromassiliense]|jgi:hypothetical protein|uniref:Zinc finger SWIM-type protein n=1 Tax=Fadolivirus FV1/VV64 TaxID=3070911 RepID=A0A7D3QU74_9VIRU|nr:zinc finger SWIM-type protein [Fadolivirus algeromassiliense]QKF93927.1 zinc finger SWIM-type protein [Fadolivirus FV1/VV64]
MSSMRKQRGTTQNLYLIEILDSTELYQRSYSVMGSTGNVYTVTIKTTPECTCPDYTTRGNRCKHIYFILMRVMKCMNVDENSYTNQQILDMFTNIPKITQNLTLDPSKKKIYDKLKNDNKLGTTSKSEVNQKDTDDLCPICLDDLTNGEELDYCKFSCGKPIHKLCYSMWTKKQPANCVFCKASWNNKETKYVNLLGH